MKILKIELQNINSLKSDSPIVIDFENEQFKDVGLYAITGSTGAGKTTILDAITIALYNKVPRFNGTKGSLIDVVSHNANDAFSRVNFENDNNIYEASWSIRVADKSGKKYKNAKEEVRLKNLSTGVILATQKKNLISQVNIVTQLDYNQFLRSVMLAQGEFASFLSAKGPDKGKLLEQITGEQIYKKIGQGILDRKSNEDNKLREIQSKINSDDVLTEDDKIELIQQDKSLDSDIIAIGNKIKSIKSIVDWYIKLQELIDKSEKLDQDSGLIEIFIAEHKAELELLNSNEKAEPFKELIQNFNRTENDSIEKSKQLKVIENELTKLDPKIEYLNKLTKNQLIDLNRADKEFTEWLPKFDLITKLDGQLKNESVNRQKSKQELNKLIQRIEALRIEAKNLTENLSDTNSKIKSEDAFINQNKFLKEVDSKISNWTRKLTILKTNKITLDEDSIFIAQKNTELIKTGIVLKEHNELLDKKIVEIEKNEKDFSITTEQLSQNNITDLLANKEKLSLTESNWKQFKTLSEQTIKIINEQTNFLSQRKIFSTNLESNRKQITTLIKQINTQENLVVKAEIILDLERRLSKYEDDRRNLKNGEPCGLCGSKEHPFVDYLAPYNVSEAELELKNIKKELKSLTNSKNELDKKEVKLNTTIDGLTQQTNSINEELMTIELLADRLNINCKLTNLSKINIELNLLNEQIKLLDENIKIVQQLQNTKNKLSESIKIQNLSVSTLKTTIATLNEKIKNSKTEIDFKQKAIDSVTALCASLENDLNISLSKFNYKLPSVEHTNIFIQEIEDSVNIFNKRQKNLDLLKSNSKVIKSNLNNNINQLETHNRTQNDYIKTINEYDAKSDKLKTERIELLPINITVERKRESLQLIKNQLANSVELSKQDLQKLFDSKTEKLTLKVKNNKEQKDLIDKLSTLSTSLDSQIKNSSFESKQDIENAILAKEDKINYTKNKERIKDNQLKIKTLKEENAKAKEILNKSKNFEISEVESKLSLEDFNKKNNDFLIEKGKIVEAYRKDQAIRDRNQEIYKKIDAQAEVCYVWKELFKIIGNSKDAFNVYVQRLTLKHLLDLANVHLYKLNKRYSLKMEDTYNLKEELNFSLIDHYQTDQARLVDTSSGGEKFIISLALALGLSDLASKNVKIDSLFIDEGFGTLDNNTLETVISTLETLQSQGKMIGIISHVENLKERIPTQIQITKKSNGVSVVDIL